jgi:hypothetical protein
VSVRLRRADPNDVSAVLLTIGEATTDAAMASLHRQTLRPQEIHVVRDVAPFHRALNEGARRVRTRFFVQVDADMTLDEGCLAELRRHARRGVGIVVAQLRDPLLGRVVGVKLFRTACFERMAFPDTVSPDTDFGLAIAAAGWRTVYIGRPREQGSDAWLTWGEHRPVYSAHYTFRKYLLEGRRYRHRASHAGLRWHFQRLEASDHPCALHAQVALAHGLFFGTGPDLLGPLEETDEFARVDAWLRAGAAGAQSLDAAPAHQGPLDVVFRHYRSLGARLSTNGRAADFHHLFHRLGPTRRDDAAWVAKIGLCRGMVAASDEGEEADWRVIEALMGAERPARPSVRQRMRALRRRLSGDGS